MLKLILVGTGGFLGAVGRYAVGEWARRAAEAGIFPFGTAIVNLLGCLAIGLLAGLAEFRGLLSPDTRVFLVVGVLGGFTTFSTFGFETYELVRAGQSSAATLNVLLNVVLGIAGVWLGFSVARFV